MFFISKKELQRRIDHAAKESCMKLIGQGFVDACAGQIKDSFSEMNVVVSDTLKSVSKIEESAETNAISIAHLAKSLGIVIELYKKLEDRVYALESESIKETNNLSKDYN